MADPIALAAALPRPLAYVLGGGASYGAVQVGMLQALAETDLRPDLVVGTSVGSLNGAVLAEEPHSAGHRLPYLWSGLNRDTVFPTKVRDAYATVRGRPYLVDPGPLTSLLVGSLQARTFADLDVPLVAVTADLDTGTVVPVDRGDLATALLASAAIPGVFPWVERDGRRLVDGGVLANVPVSVALDRGARSVVVLDCGFVVSQPRRTDTFLGVLLQTAAVMTAHQVRYDLRRAADAGVPVLYLPGPWPIGSPPYSFERTAELAQAAYALSSEFLRTLRVDGGRVYGTPPGTVT
ncbi:MAG: patatin-like phospholipase family protein [Candidatus Nanopelagicales bacterium]